MSYFLILVILALGALAHSRLVMLAALFLTILKLLRLQNVLLFISERGIELGLLLLILTVLIPLVTDQVSLKDLKETVTTVSGLLAIIGGLLATKLNGMGINLLKIEPHLIIGMIIGAIMGILFWGGVPVGPLMAGGLTALFIKIFQLFR